MESKGDKKGLQMSGGGERKTARRKATTQLRELWSAEWDEVPKGLKKQEATQGEAKDAALQILQHTPENARQGVRNAMSGFFVGEEEVREAWDEMLREVIAVPAAAGPSEQPQRRQHSAERVQASAVELTYNGSEDFLSTDPCVLEALWARFLVFVKSLVQEKRVQYWTAKMEQSLNAAQPRVHLHLYLSMPKGKKLDVVLPTLAFENNRPHIETNTAHGKAYLPAMRQGHFYNWAWKHGSLHRAANYTPRAQGEATSDTQGDYTILGAWLDNLRSAQKIDDDLFLKYACQIRKGFAARLRDVQAAQRYEKEAAIRDAVATAQAQLAPMVRDRCDFDEIDEFKRMVLGTAFRRPMLAIIGASGLGKSMLGAAVLREFGPEFLELTVEDNEHLDMSDFDYARHSGLLLDGVGDVLFLKKNREALQGRAKACKGGMSATMLYSYPFTLVNKPVIATFDLSAKNLQLFDNDHWLSQRWNVIPLFLKHPAFQSSSVKRGAPSSPAPGAALRAAVLQSPPRPPAAKEARVGEGREKP